MDGAKHDTDTSDIFIKNIVVDRRTFCAEVFPKGRVEREVMRILAGVGTNFAENRKIS